MKMLIMLMNVLLDYSKRFFYVKSKCSWHLLCYYKKKISYIYDYQMCSFTIHLQI